MSCGVLSGLFDLLNALSVYHAYDLALREHLCVRLKRISTMVFSCFLNVILTSLCNKIRRSRAFHLVGDVGARNCRTQRGGLFQPFGRFATEGHDAHCGKKSRINASGVRREYDMISMERREWYER